MKILIADDQATRYKRLISALSEVGVARDCIEIVTSTDDARSRLESTRYDLLILDILLPNWPEQTDFTSENSLQLLMELSQSDDLEKPGHIVGITGDRTIVSDEEAVFLSSTWIVVEYSASDDIWVEQITNCVNYILSKTQDNSCEEPGYLTDLAIICALPKPELEEILKLDWNWSAPRPIDDIVFVRDGWFLSGSKKLTVVAASAQRMGMVASAILTSKLISATRPKMVVMTGICAGVKSKVKAGDVLFADPSWDFQSGKKVVDKDIARLSIAPHQIAADAKVRSHVQQLSSDTGELTKLYDGNAPAGTSVPNIHIGPVASGSAVLADGQTIKEIRQQHRALLGVEMEIYGVFAAASDANVPRPKVFALKAVCDFADSDKGDEMQRYASHTSAGVLRLLMEKHGTRLI